MGKYGAFAADGSIADEATECAVSGRPVLGEHCTLIYIGNKHFVRVLSQQKEFVTDEMRESWTQEAGGNAEPIAQPEPPPRKSRASKEENES